ncbi:hypothetical protein HYW41_01295 [Candidatus Daviesbacteria bacterium]|nr:hypothetical protein [Candidatus Daviesbacteria bacterium]
MDNLPKDPPDENKPPPPFGVNFNPHSNPVDPNNPYASQPQPPSQTPISNTPNPSNTPDQQSIHEEVARHRLRDAEGHFLPYEHPVGPQPQTPPTAPTVPNNPNPAPSGTGLPPLVETNPKQDTKDEDPPLIKVTNPVTYFKRWWNKLMSKEGIDFKMGFKIKPVTAVLITSIIITGGVSSGITAFVLKTFWPTSSPVLHRQIIQSGTIQTGTGGFYLASQDQSIWKLKPKKPNINLNEQVGKQVTVTGNLTKEANLIEVSEIILSDSSKTPLTPVPSPSSIPSNPSFPSNPPDTPNSPNLPNSASLPSLYPSLTWEITQSKVLIFTSGRRKIEQEGVYLESAQVAELPQEFINYYTNELTNAGFKQTFNSSDPNGTTITYAKDDLFLTFGIKNIYTGSGEDKKLVGYKAFIEHN